MKKLLLDTSLIIDFLRTKNKEKTLFTALVKGQYDLHISIITHTELYSGKSVWEKEGAKEELESLLSGLVILQLGHETSKKAGNIKALNNIDLIDAIIAATALVHNLKLATLNIKDFEDIKGLRLLKHQASFLH